MRTLSIAMHCNAAKTKRDPSRCPTHCRALEGKRLDKQLAEAVASILDRAEAGAGLGAAKSKADRRLVSDSWDLHWTALVSARNAIQGQFQLNHQA